MLKKLNKIANWLIIILLIVNIYIFSAIMIFNRSVDVPIVFPTQSQYIMAYNILNEDYEEFDKSKEEVRNFIAKDLGLKFYFYKEKQIQGFSGKAYVIPRLIMIDSEVNGIEYAKVFTHEVIHLKKMIKNESWVCFETFKYLYEHEELHNVGVWYGQKQLQGCYGGEYNIADLIVNYLTNK